MRDASSQLADGSHLFGLQQLILSVLDFLEQRRQFLVGAAELVRALGNLFFQAHVGFREILVGNGKHVIELAECIEECRGAAVHFPVFEVEGDLGCLAGLDLRNLVGHVLIFRQDMEGQPGREKAVQHFRRILHSRPRLPHRDRQGVVLRPRRELVAEPLQAQAGWMKSW